MWTFPTTLVMSGQQIAEDLPFTDVSFTDELMGSGAFTGTLPLPHRALPADLTRTATRLQTWCCRDDVPFGVFTWAAVRQPNLAEPVVQVSGVRSDAFAFARRPVQETLAFTDQDAYDVVRDLFRHGQGDKTLFTDSPVGPWWWQPYGALPWFRVSDVLSGVPVTKTRVVNGQQDNGWWRRQQKPVADAVKSLAEELGFEVHPRCGVDPDTGALFQRMDFGSPIGLPAGSANAIVIEFPSPAVVSGSYGWDASDLRTATAVVGGEAQGDSSIGYYEPTFLLDRGYPYARTATSVNGVTDQEQLTAAAVSAYTRAARVRESFNLTLNGQAHPMFGTYGVGDCLTLRVDQGAGLVDRTLRIAGWSIKIDDTRTSEQVTPTLSEVPL